MNNEWKYIKTCHGYYDGKKLIGLYRYTKISSKFYVKLFHYNIVFNEWKRCNNYEPVSKNDTEITKLDVLNIISNYKNDGIYYYE